MCRASEFIKLILKQISTFDKLCQACHAESLLATSCWHGPCVLKRVVGTEARLKAGTLTIFYCVTSTEKKKKPCAMNWEQHIYTHHERFYPIKTLQLQTNHTSFSNKVKQQTTCTCSFLCIFTG